MGGVESGPTNRNGNTRSEIQAWTDRFPDDDALNQQAQFLHDLVEKWHDGLESEEVLREIYKHYVDTASTISDAAGAMLIQSPMWFAYEAGIPIETSVQIGEEFLDQLREESNG